MRLYDDLGGEAILVKVIMDKEPGHFFRLFGGHFIVFMVTICIKLDSVIYSAIYHSAQWMGHWGAPLYTRTYCQCGKLHNVICYSAPSLYQELCGCNSVYSAIYHGKPWVCQELWGCYKIHSVIYHDTPCICQELCGCYSIQCHIPWHTLHMSGAMWML